MRGLVGSVLYGADHVVASHVAARIPGMRDCSDFGPFTALGVVRNGVLLGGVVYHGFREYPSGNIVEVSIAFDRGDFAFPGTLRVLFGYAFNQLGCVRMEAMISARNDSARRFIKALGFIEEGKHPLRWLGCGTAFSYGITRQKCRFLRNTDGQE